MTMMFLLFNRTNFYSVFRKFSQNLFSNVKGTISILLGYENGSFAAQKTFSSGNNPHTVAVGDFNNDNRSDIVVTNWLGATACVLLGDGNGSFSTPTTFPTGYYPY
jgi:hypothetical protein